MKFEHSNELGGSSRRFSVTGTAGSRDGKKFAVLDSADRDERGGRKRVSWHRTFTEAQAEAKRRNRGQS